jgi:hypothetical protein
MVLSFLLYSLRRRRTRVPELISPLELIEEENLDQAEPAIGTPPDDLDAIRELVLRAHPDVVPELVSGTSVAELLASVEPARSAYARLVDAIAVQRPVPEATVPAGGGAPIAIDPDRLPAAEKIRRGLATSAVQKG